MSSDLGKSVSEETYAGYYEAQTSQDTTVALVYVPGRNNSSSVNGCGESKQANTA